MPESIPETRRVVVYSDDAKLRDAVRMAVGRRPAPDTGRVEWVEAGSNLEILAAVDAGGVDLVILDGEARPTGGLGLAKQLKDELKDCPPTLVLVARKDDTWLASWSLADAVLPLPVDPPALREAAATLLRQRQAALPVRRSAAI
jgi:DNA-binding response OmpR family regulator